MLQGLCQCISSGLSDHLASVWVEEAKRAFTTGLCRSSDDEWAQRYIQFLGLSKVMHSNPELCDPLALNYVLFVSDFW